MQITDSQEFVLTVTGGIDRAGNPVPGPVPGVLAWSSSDETLVTVVAAADGLSAVVSSTGSLGTGTVVRVTDDIDSDGTADFDGSLVVDVVVGAVVGLTLEAGTPTERQIV